MMHLFAAGELVRDPERRTAKSGNDYATALMRSGEDLVSLAVFDTDLVERLLALVKGDPLAISGRLQVSVYDAKDGETRCGLSVTVTRLMTVPVRTIEVKPRSRPVKPGVPNRTAEPAPPTEDELDDEIPF
jgi:single-stranded DNA-binding protein